MQRPSSDATAGEEATSRNTATRPTRSSRSVLDWRYGCIDLHEFVSQVHFAPDQYSAGHSNDEIFNASCAAIRRSLAEPEYDDVRAMADEFIGITGYLDRRDGVSEQQAKYFAALKRLRSEKRTSLQPPGFARENEPIHQINSIEGLIDMINYIGERDHQISTVIEVGAYAGVSGELFALHFPDVVSVDPWAGDAEHAKLLFDARRADYLNWTALQMPSTDAAGLLPDGVADLIYIDADHALASVLADLRAWKPKLRKGGWLCGHDWGNEPGVAPAVLEVLGEPDAIFSDNSWCKRL